MNYQRRAQLLEGAVDYAITHGIADLSLRPVAAALAVTTTTLVHHFGTREQLLESILNRVRERIFEVLDVDQRSGEDAASLIRDVWAWTSAPEHHALFRLFFAVYGRSLQQPDGFETFRERVVDDWLTLLTRGFEHEGHTSEAAKSYACLGLAVIRGLLLDLLTTGDSTRTSRALEDFATTLPRSCRPGGSSSAPSGRGA